MGWYERVVFRRAMERVLGRVPIRAERAATLAPVRGAILEVGMGTGLNPDIGCGPSLDVEAALARLSGVDQAELVLVDIDAGALSASEARLSRHASERVRIVYERPRHAGDRRPREPRR